MQDFNQDDKSFSLIQPGSSVATALSEGESKKKHVVLFEINGDSYRCVNYPLETVRPFVHDNVSIEKTACLHSEHTCVTAHTVDACSCCKSHVMQRKLGALFIPLSDFGYA